MIDVSLIHSHTSSLLSALDVITEHTIDDAEVLYVDDLNVCSNRRIFASDMSRVDDEVRTLLGPSSVAADKDKSGRRLDMMGWLIDLDAQQLVTIFDWSFDKTVYAFLSFNVDEPARSWLRWRLATHRFMC